MSIIEIINKVSKNQDLTFEESEFCMNQIMSGNTLPSQFGALMTALAIKGETSKEIAGMASVMREFSIKIKGKSNAIDVCGTGGSGLKWFNISTASAILISSCGIPVAKHGNRSASSTSGSADLLEEAGVNLNLSSDQVAKCIDTVGVGFMFAPSHHSAMKHVMGPRKELGIRTIFNILGPLTNPAGAANQVIGVFDKSWVMPIAEVLKGLGSNRVMVVHSQDGLDEFSIQAPTLVAELRDNKIIEYSVVPEDLGIERSSISGLKVSSPSESLFLARDSLGGQNLIGSQMISIASGAALYVSGIAQSLEEGFNESLSSIQDGKGIAKLDELISVTNSFKK